MPLGCNMELRMQWQEWRSVERGFGELVLFIDPTKLADRR